MIFKVINENNRFLNLDVDTTITPCDIVLYRDSIEDTQLIVKLIKGNFFYTIPANSKIRFYINGSLQDENLIKIVNRFRGEFVVKLNDKLFENNGFQELKFVLFSLIDSDSMEQTFITNVLVVNGIDSLEQSVKSMKYNNTNIETPINPNPDFSSDITN